MDLEIIRALEAGDPRSLEWIFEAYGHDCIRRLQRYERCSPEDAEDIFMDALLIYWQQVRQGKVRELSRSGPYIYRICVCEQRQRYRQRQQAQAAYGAVQNQLYEQPFEPSWIDKQVQQETATEWTRDAQAALHRLGDRCQRVIRYFYVQKLPLEEIARRLGVADAGVAKTMRYRCYQRWLKHLREIRKND